MVIDFHSHTFFSDAHAAEDMLTAERWKAIGLGAGLTEAEWLQVERAGRSLLEQWAGR